MSASAQPPSDPRGAVLTSKALLLIRILVGWVFVSEGIQKFIFPAQLGIGRFQQIGIPDPRFMAPFVGVVEIVCGTLLLIGWFAAGDRSTDGRDCDRNRHY